MTFLTQTEAYELLGAEIGEALPLNGVHGTLLVKIAEKLLAATDRAKGAEAVLDRLCGAKALDLTPNSILIITDPEGAIHYDQVVRLKEKLHVKAVILLPDGAEMDLVGDELLQLHSVNLLDTFPQLHKPVRDHLEMKELSALKKCVEAMRMQMQREEGTFFIPQPSARVVWEEALAEAEKILP